MRFSSSDDTSDLRRTAVNEAAVADRTSIVGLEDGGLVFVVSADASRDGEA